MKKIGLLGCGAIGTVIARAIDAGEIDASLTHVYDASAEASERLAASLKSRPAVAENAHMLSSYPVDIVVEAASQEAVRDYALSVIQNRRELVVMSVGALLDEAVFEVLGEACAEFGRSIHVPSGAIAGLDALRAVSAEIDELTLTTTKHPDSLRGAPGAPSLPESGAATVFDGSAAEAVEAFPKNVNVAALLSLATGGSAQIRVRVIADNAASSNMHEIEARGAFGRISLAVSNVPDPSNPKTSRLAALSAVDLLRRMCAGQSSVVIGS